MSLAGELVEGAKLDRDKALEQRDAALADAERLAGLLRQVIRPLQNDPTNSAIIDAGDAVNNIYGVIEKALTAHESQQGVEEKASSRAHKAGCKGSEVGKSCACFGGVEEKRRGKEGV